MRQSSCRQNHTVHVIIIGCSVAGLTLAHALSKRRIDYTILEAHDRLPLPFTGNAFTLLPNGSRILAQLKGRIDVGRLLSMSPTRHGYKLAVIPRWRFLQNLYNNLEDKHRVCFGKRVMTVDQSSSEAKVECADDSIFTGDLVVGADRIHSVSRGEILRWNGSLQAPQDLRKVAVTVTSEYSGIYGVSHPIPGLSPGHAHRTYGDGFSFIINIGKENIFWLLSFHAGKVHRYPDVPRYSQDRASIDQQVFPFLDAHISSNIRFEKLYHNTITCCHVTLEKMLCEQWVAGRLVCIGNSVHKMTPNLDQANCIVHNPGKDMDLAVWEESRKQRMRRFYTYSWILARCEAFSGLWFKALGLYIWFFHGEQVISHISDINYHLKSPSKMDHGELNQMNYLYVKLAFWLLDVLITIWSFCFV
ncbi:hypothetical protein BDV24DRAFT_178597 [Aspergillus arachidicola]|uniref:FAD-binding domain-containing protein n=1 Tax=Aspergillus arachidicola TaxID=656916 RepID=A0A5N6XT44_9EURO|nr:hypothetical protein BDV24DRAFT_178597 [Aspergillus arachidicola]